MKDCYEVRAVATLGVLVHRTRTKWLRPFDPRALGAQCTGAGTAGGGFKQIVADVRRMKTYAPTAASLEPVGQPGSETTRDKQYIYIYILPHFRALPYP